MKKLFKHGNKRVIDTKLVKDAMKADAPIEDFEELIEVDSEQRLKEWMNGFGTGIATAVGGIVVGFALAAAASKINSKD